jgi:hypothetical protein
VVGRKNAPPEARQRARKIFTDDSDIMVLATMVEGGGGVLADDKRARLENPKLRVSPPLHKHNFHWQHCQCSGTASGSRQWPGAVRQLWCHGSRIPFSRLSWQTFWRN